MEGVYASSALDFCCVRPTGPANGPETHAVRQINGFPMNARIRCVDVAWWMVDHICADFAADRYTITTGAK